jgi:DNA-binding protein WhiA
MNDSFSQKIKSEICRRGFRSNHSRFLFLYGILCCLKNFTEEKIIFKTSNNDTRKLFETLVQNISGEKNAINVTQTAKSNGTELFKIEVSPAASKALIKAYNYKGLPDVDLINGVMSDDFISGVFCAVGSLSNPKSGYHLEFSFKKSETADIFIKLLGNLYWGSKLRKIERKTYVTVYMKDSESIGDFLTYIGLSEAALEFMNTEVFKDVINKANRIANCDSANIERALSAGVKQIEDIERIYKTKGREFLSPGLREIADLRLENPDVSLKELGEMTSVPLTRSGVNHRLMKIHKISENL